MYVCECVIRAFVCLLVCWLLLVVCLSQFVISCFVFEFDIYIYIEREREMCVHVYVYIYIYIYIHVYTLLFVLFGPAARPAAAFRIGCFVGEWGVAELSPLQRAMPQATE